MVFELCGPELVSLILETWPGNFAAIIQVLWWPSKTDALCGPSDAVLKFEHDFREFLLVTHTTNVYNNPVLFKIIQNLFMVSVHMLKHIHVFSCTLYIFVLCTK